MPIERKLEIHQEISLNHQPTNYPTSIQSPQPSTTHQHPETRPHIPWRSRRSPVVLRRKRLANLLQWRRIVLRRWISHHHQRHVAIEPGKFSFSDQPNGASKRETLCICIRTCTKKINRFFEEVEDHGAAKNSSLREFLFVFYCEPNKGYTSQSLNFSPLKSYKTPKKERICFSNVQPSFFRQKLLNLSGCNSLLEGSKKWTNMYIFKFRDLVKLSVQLYESLFFGSSHAIYLHAVISKW